MMLRPLEGRRFAAEKRHTSPLNLILVFSKNTLQVAQKQPAGQAD
jgi:hypothetical protein